LQRLSLKHSDIDLQVATGSIVSFLRRSSCVVKSLSIRLTNLTDNDLVQITRLTPSLEKLSLVRCPSGASEFIGFSQALSSHLSSNHPSLTPKPLLPSLQVFKWLGDDAFPWRVLPSFFAPLTLGSTSPGRPLTKIQIYCLRLVDGSPIPYIDDDILRQLSKFADKVKFNFGYSTDDGYDGDLWKVSVERGKCPEQGERLLMWRKIMSGAVPASNGLRSPDLRSQPADNLRQFLPVVGQVRPQEFVKRRLRPDCDFRSNGSNLHSRRGITSSSSIMSSHTTDVEIMRLNLKPLLGHLLGDGKPVKALSRPQLSSRIHELRSAWTGKLQSAFG
ncbi:hypothetical protein CVT26_000566, partial [Gymnopilus dilepis]